MANMFTDLTPEGKRYFQQLKELESLEVKVGYQRGEVVTEEGADMVDIAAYNELGSSNTPARPFMKQSFENHEDELKKSCEEVNQTLAQGGTAQEALSKLGVFCKGLVQDEIVNGGFAPNAESTIKRKGSETPLIDSGHMRQSVNFVIKKAK